MTHLVLAAPKLGLLRLLQAPEMVRYRSEGSHVMGKAPLKHDVIWRMKDMGLLEPKVLPAGKVVKHRRIREFSLKGKPILFYHGKISGSVLISSTCPGVCPLFCGLSNTAELCFRQSLSPCKCCERKRHEKIKKQEIHIVTTAKELTAPQVRDCLARCTKHFLSFLHAEKDGKLQCSKRCFCIYQD